MSLPNRTLDQLTLLDRLARRSTALKRIDPRAQLLVTLALLVTIASFEPHDLTRPTPLLLFFVVTIGLGEIPAAVIVKRLVIASPFALLIGVWNPIFDHAPRVLFGSIAIGAGWLSFLSVLIRFAFALGAVLILIASTGFNELCRAAQSLGAPRVLTTQLLLLYRYSFLIVDEIGRTLRCYALRAQRRAPPSFGVFRSMLAALFLRSLARAERVHAAMLCRGFSGSLPRAGSRGFTRLDLAYVAGWIAFFGAVRSIDFTQWIGGALLTFG